ncbi:MAG: hypothetical protein ACRCZ0_11040 [Cetobacterium sp.]
MSRYVYSPNRKQILIGIKAVLDHSNLLLEERSCGDCFMNKIIERTGGDSCSHVSYWLGGAPPCLKKDNTVIHTIENIIKETALIKKYFYVKPLQVGNDIVCSLNGEGRITHIINECYYSVKFKTPSYLATKNDFTYSLDGTCCIFKCAITTNKFDIDDIDKFSMYRYVARNDGRVGYVASVSDSVYNERPILVSWCDFETQDSFSLDGIGTDGYHIKLHNFGV